jgi:hypothetical protein
MLPFTVARFLCAVFLGCSVTAFGRVSILAGPSIIRLVFRTVFLGSPLDPSGIGVSGFGGWCKAWSEPVC